MATKSKKADPLATMRERFGRAVEFDAPMRADAVDDLKFGFIPGNQWDAHLKRKRKNRPVYEFNKVRQHSKQVTNDMRQNRPQIKVVATRNGTKRAGEIMQGLVRNIEAASHADEAYDTAGFFSANGGFGVIGIETAYTDDSAFEQDIRIKEKRNPFAVLFDPSAKEKDKRDGRFAFEPERISKLEFKERWPKASPVDFESAKVFDAGDWWGADDVRIARYWERDPVEKRIVLLSDGRVVDAAEFDKIADELANPRPGPDGAAKPPVTKVSERIVQSWEVKVSIVSGTEVLEGPTPWPGKFIPLVPVWGDLINIEGKEHWYGQIRPMKDAQRLYNFDRCSMIEVVAKQPKSPMLYTPAMVLGHEAQWEGMSESNAEALPYNVDPKAPNGGRPTREAPPAFPTAMLQLAQIDNDDIKAVSGQHDPSLGVRKGQQSGRAILALQREGDVATFDYTDNLARAIRFVGEQLVDLIPKVYDTERVERILGEDGSEDYVTLNEQVFDDESQTWVKVNDLSQAKYDVAVAAGPSFTTQRMETADSLMQLATGGGPAAGLAMYGALKNMDTPGLDETVKGLRRILVAQKLLEPEEGEQPEAPPPPNPKDVADAKSKEAQARKYNADADQTQVETHLLLERMSGVPVPIGPDNQEFEPEPAQAGFFMGDPSMGPQEPSGPF